MDRRAFRKLAGSCLAVLCCVGCGYTAGFTMPEGIETIHVKVFRNRTFYRGLDFDITQVLKREIMARTELTVVREKDADVVFSGTVDKVEEFVRRKDRNGIPQEMEIKLTISAVAKSRTGRVLFQEKELNRTVKYIIVLGEDERLARSRALREVAEELVYRLAEKWGWKKEKAKEAVEKEILEEEMWEEEMWEEEMWEEEMWEEEMWEEEMREEEMYRRNTEW